MNVNSSVVLSDHELTRGSFNLAIKKWVLWLLILIVIASIERYLWATYYQISGDLVWYLNEDRAVQYTFLGFDKQNVSILIDQFSSYDSKLWIASIVSGLMFSLAVFSSNRNQGFKRMTPSFLMVVLLLLMNMYFIQLDMHLWRQQLSFYGFMIAVNQERFVPKAIFALIAFFFHEVALLLFALYFLSGYLNYLYRSVMMWNFVLIVANMIIFAVAIKAGFSQVSVINFFCVVMLFSNQDNQGVRRKCIFIVLLSACGLFALMFTSLFVVGEASAERLVYIAVMSGLFLFFTTTSLVRAPVYRMYHGKELRFRSENINPSDVISLRTVVLTSIKFVFVVYYATFI